MAARVSSDPLEGVHPIGVAKGLMSGWVEMIEGMVAGEEMVRKGGEQQMWFSRRTLWVRGQM